MNMCMNIGAYDMLYNVRQCLASSGAPDLSDMMYVNVGNLLNV